ncbi:efflux transporter outer membrane subunit [Kiritimatiellaeota bacterium B1221]|nr:efflux transporter outer membrane subunit [Kiritimatiellaeota bacterium B1221]
MTNHKSPPFSFPFLRALTAGSASLLLFSACTTPSVPPADYTDLQIPTAWHQTSDLPQKASAETDLSEWWSRFQDPVMDQLIKSALTHNPDLKTALLNVEAARAQKGLTNAALWPSLDAGLSSGAHRVDDRVNDNTSHNESYGANLSASWEVDLFRKQSDSLQSAEADLRASEQDFHAAQVLLAAEVAEAYLNFRSLQQEYHILTGTIAVREQTLQIVRWQYEAGEVNFLDVQQAIVFLEQARTALPSLEQNIEESLNALTLLCGEIPGNLHDVLESGTDLPSLPQEITSPIPAEVLAQRPDILAARYRIESATADLSAAEKERLPSLTLTGSISLDEENFSNLLDPTQILSNLIGSLTAPVWDADRIKNQIVLEDINLRQSILAYESEVLNALSEVENALSAIGTSAREIKVTQTATEAARLSTQIAEFQFETGDVDLLSVLESQRSQLSLEQSLINANINQLIAHIQLYRALGGGWSAPAAN